MSLVLGVVADDYTGASDLANALTRNGLSTVQTIGVPDDALRLPDVDAVVVALKSRSIAAGEAVARSLAADQWLRARGAGHVIFKICSTFDSTDAGNIGPVTEALAREAGETAVLVTPAFPQTRRTVYQGHLFVGDRPLDESPMKDHPLNPMRDADLVRVLQRQMKGRVALADLDVVEQGAAALAARRAALAADGVGAVVVDAIFDRHLETIGVVAAQTALSVGASGLGVGAARALVAAGRARGLAQAAAPAPVGGPAVCLAGSCSQATLAQIAVAERKMPVLRLSVEDVMEGRAVARARAFADERLRDGAVLIASSDAAAGVGAAQARYGRARASAAIERAFGDMAQAFAASGVRRMVVAGGETSGAVVDGLRLPAFVIGAEIAPGVPVLHAVGAGAMTLALKSGNFGGPDFFADALAMMP